MGGGLFNVARQEVQNKIYEKWEDLSPALKSTLESLHEEQQPLILHAAIISKAPSNILQRITNQFEYSVTKTDSLHRYPVEVALKQGLSWKDGLQQILKTSVLIQQQEYPTKIMISAAKYGLKWRHHMK